MNIFSKKTKPLVTSLIILVGVFGVGIGAVAQINSVSGGFLGSQGLQTKHGRLVLTEDTTTDVSDSNPSNSIDEPWLPDLRIFVDDKISSFAELTSNGVAHVTPSTTGASSYATFGGNASNTTSRVFVDGNILATNFTNSADFSAVSRLCTDSNGVIKTCGTVASQPGICGDGTIDTGEQCDDGNTIGGDTCSSTCQNSTDINKISAHFCNISGDYPRGPSMLYSFMETNDYTNAQEVSLPTSSPDYNSTFIDTWEWESANLTYAEWLAFSPEGKDPSNQSMSAVFTGAPYLGLNGTTTFSSIESAMSPQRTFSASSATQYEGGIIYQSFTDSGTYELPEGIFRVRALDSNNNPATDWTYINTLAPAALSYRASTTLSGDPIVEGRDMLVSNTSTYGGTPEISWTHALNDTPQMSFFSYVIQRKSESDEDWTTLVTANSSNPITSYTDNAWSGLSSGVYEYRVFVQNTCGGSVTVDPSTTELGETYNVSNTIEQFKP